MPNPTTVDLSIESQRLICSFLDLIRNVNLTDKGNPQNIRLVDYCIAKYVKEYFEQRGVVVPSPQVNELPQVATIPANLELTEEDKKLIYECFDVIRQEKKASTSNLQRRLRLGYNRAAYVIEYLERIGVLGPANGATPREILVNLDTYMLEF